MMLRSFEMDARRAGFQQGMTQGVAQGMRQGEVKGLERGKVEGSRQKAFETARILKQFGDSVQKIAQATGLTKEEIEKL